jgi:signal transduction histidine kinase
VVILPHAPENCNHGEDLSPDPFSKAAALRDSLVHNHPFVDGNQRTGVAAAGLFLLQNGYRLDTTSAEPEAFTRHVTGSRPEIVEIAAEDLCVPEETALSIYRIAQEALHNAIQHADASEIAVRLTQYPARLRMTITDGADLRRFVTEGYLGLAGMRERAAMIGGHLDIQSAPGYGTVVILEAPC